MKDLTRVALVTVILLSVFFFACRQEKEVAAFTYRGILFEGFNPVKHKPTPELARGVEMEQVMITHTQMRTLMGIVDMLEKENLLYLMEIPGRFVLVNCPYSFADKPQMTIYLDRQKINMDYSVADDWQNKLSKFTPGLTLEERISLRGVPKLPNLLRIIIHEVGHLIEYKVLGFSWQGEFIANELNRDFVEISWDKENNWRDREKILLRLETIREDEELVEFLTWFAGNSSFFSVYSSTGMTEDFAESFVSYYFKTHFDYALQLFYRGELRLADLTAPTKGREEKIGFIAGVMQDPELFDLIKKGR
ncbi:MAG: hypothetical protein GX085_07025 [Firmicutes bacterium]|nr:hypothetical protein [Bacillota bacterium]